MYLSSSSLEEEFSEKSKQLGCFQINGSNCRIVTTPYNGYENDLLEMRNRNRTSFKGREYMDWRYKQLEGNRAARLFWIELYNGIKIGVAGVVFRKYYVRGKLEEVGVLGDIALETEYRGKGLGKKLFDTINRSFHEDDSTIGFVIPNEMAKRPLKATGWETVDRLVPYVMNIEPMDKFVMSFGNKTAIVIGKIIRKSLLLLLRLQVDKEMEFISVTLNHSTLINLWERLSENKLVMRDRRMESLLWRYKEHPKGGFIFLECRKGKQSVALLVIRLNPNKETCIIYDFIGKLKGMHKVLRALALWLYREKGVNKLRFVVNEKRFFFKGLQRFGFIKRPALNDVLLYNGPGFQKEKDLHWYVTSGDKDV